MTLAWRAVPALPAQRLDSEQGVYRWRWFLNGIPGGVNAAWLPRVFRSVRVIRDAPSEVSHETSAKTVADRVRAVAAGWLCIATGLSLQRQCRRRLLPRAVALWQCRHRDLQQWLCLAVGCGLGARLGLWPRLVGLRRHRLWRHLRLSAAPSL